MARYFDLWCSLYKWFGKGAKVALKGLRFHKWNLHLLLSNSMTPMNASSGGQELYSHWRMATF